MQKKITNSGRRVREASSVRRKAQSLRHKVSGVRDTTYKIKGLIELYKINFTRTLYTLRFKPYALSLTPCAWKGRNE